MGPFFGFPLINNLNEVALFDEVKDGRNARLTEYLVKVIQGLIMI